MAEQTFDGRIIAITGNTFEVDIVRSGLFISDISRHGKLGRALKVNDLDEDYPVKVTIKIERK